MDTLFVRICTTTTEVKKVFSKSKLVQLTSYNELPNSRKVPLVIKL